MVLEATGVRDLRDNRDKGPFFALTNWTSDVDIDCNSATNDELSDLLGQLNHQYDSFFINSLKHYGDIEFQKHVWRSYLT